MPRYVAFLRAVNVGGRFVTMAQLREALTAAGFDDVETHIQSGNVLVGSRRRSVMSVATELERCLGEWAGFEIPAMVRTTAEVTDLVGRVDGIPPLHGGTEGRRYVAFASGPIPPGAAESLDGWDRPGERAVVLGADVLAEFTRPFHEITLTNARIEKITGLTTTWRDLGVVRDIAEKWGDR